MPKKKVDDKGNGVIQVKHTKKRRWTSKFYRRAALPNRGEEWDWRAKAPNGNIVATSGGQGYTTLAKAKKSQKAFFDAIIDGRIYEEGDK